MTDADFMLAVLSEHPDEWVSQMEIIRRSEQQRQCGLTPHSRASTLRDRGHVIENRVERVGKRAISYYRLRPSLSSAPVSAVPEWAAGIGAVESEALARPDLAGGRKPSGIRTEPEDASLTLFDTPRKPAWA